METSSCFLCNVKKGVCANWIVVESNMRQKGMTRKSIFDIECRLNLIDEYQDILEDLDKSEILINGKKLTIISVMDESIKDWPHRHASASIVSFIKKRIRNCCSSQELSEEEKDLLILELFINLLKWAPVHYKFLSDPLAFHIGEPSMSFRLEKFIENIEYVIEQCNMKVCEIQAPAFPKYVITKRDADVDTTIDIAPELSEVLLSYMDIRNATDEDFKKNAIKTLADYLEPKRYSFNGTGYKGLCDDVFYAFNTVSVRHNNDKQVTLKKTERMKLYDALFRMSLHLIQKERIDEYRSFIQEIKGQSVGQRLTENDSKQ